MPVVAGGDTARGEFVAVGYVGVGLNGKQPALLQEPPVLGEQIKLMAATLQGAALEDDQVPVIDYQAQAEAEPRLALPLTLAWQAARPPDTDYVTLVHLVAADGTLAKQYDRAPLQGVAPTTIWREGDTLIDTYDLDIPPDLPAGEYRLLVGLYDLPTLTRLPVQREGAPAGDTIHVATIRILPNRVTSLAGS
jgi:hypothetical protein